nr:MAG TPA: hypothetical protein [Siphoviridae sp. ctHdl3]
MRRSSKRGRDLTRRLTRLTELSGCRNQPV